ncbi:MAG: lysylphosphatidylglycerol synthase transmembrane domain-containing protein [Anaerolineales bacterium]|jgi:uncharacterized membrane protein YbhN (UPF0104 family)
MTSDSKRSEVWQTALRLAGTLVALGLLAYLLAQLGWREFLDALAQIPWTAFALALAMVSVSRIAGVSRWYFLLRSAEVVVPWRRAFVLTFASLFASNFLPTTVGGDVIRIAGVAQVDSRRTAYVTSVFADRIVGLFGMAMALPFGVGPLISYAHGTAAGTLLPLTGVAVGGSWFSRIRARLRSVAQAVLESLNLWRQNPASVFCAFASTWVIMLGRFGSIWVLLHALDQSISLGTIAGLWSFTYFVTLVPVSINGLGLQELSMTFIYVALGGVSTASILPTAILVRVMDTLVSVPGALMLPQSLAWSRGRGVGTDVEL